MAYPWQTEWYVDDFDDIVMMMTINVEIGFAVIPSNIAVIPSNIAVIPSNIAVTLPIKFFISVETLKTEVYLDEWRRYT